MQVTTSTPYLENDKNTIISALMKKGIEVNPGIKVTEPKDTKVSQSAQKAGPAEKKLKSLFKR